MTYNCSQKWLASIREQVIAQLSMKDRREILRCRRYFSHSNTTPNKVVKCPAWHISNTGINLSLRKGHARGNSQRTKNRRKDRNNSRCSKRNAIQIKKFRKHEEMRLWKWDHFNMKSKKTPEKMQSINVKVRCIIALKTSCRNHLHSLCEVAERPVLWLEALLQQNFHFVSSCEL